MAANFQVNISINAGADFGQEFTMANSDMSPKDWTGIEFFANLSKHEASLNAVKSTSTDPVWAAVPFTTQVVNAENGVYNISLTGAQTAKLEEGKYVYNVIMLENGTYISVVGGLAFVTRSAGWAAGFGTVENPFA